MSRIPQEMPVFAWVVMFKLLFHSFITLKPSQVPRALDGTEGSYLTSCMNHLGIGIMYLFLTSP